MSKRHFWWIREVVTYPSLYLYTNIWWMDVELWAICFQLHESCLFLYLSITTLSWIKMKEIWVGFKYIPINLLFVRSHFFLVAGWEPTSSENQPCLSVYLSKHVGSFALASVWLSYLTLILFYSFNLGITYIITFFVLLCIS